MKKILVISPHPDDEILGCGGTLAKQISIGNTVEIIVLTSGEGGIKGKSALESMRIREEESRNVAGFLGFSRVEFWREKDGEFQITREMVRKLLKRIKEYKPDELFVTHHEEQHSDHQQACNLVRETMRMMPSLLTIPEVWMYEVWTPLQILNRIEDISEFADIKRKAIKLYKSQCEVMDFENAILGLNRYRGEMHSWPGGDYAEVFREMKKF